MNKATKLSNYFLSLNKEYTAKIKLGISTDSWDLEGKIINLENVRNVEIGEMISMVKELKGDFNQIPPVYSAIKYKGKPAYCYARNNEEIVLKSRLVKIYDIKLISFLNMEVVLKICCSAGTYIRSIANEIGKRTGCGAALTSLTRDKIGDFSIHECVNLEKMIQDSISSENNLPGILKSYKYGIIPVENLKSLDINCR